MYYDLTLLDLCRGSFDLNCTVDIYDCTTDPMEDQIYWGEGCQLIVSTFGCNEREISAVDPELLNARIRYITVSNNHLIIEVVKD